MQSASVLLAEPALPHAWATAAASQPIPVATISPDGVLTRGAVTKTTLIREGKLHARDIVLLLTGYSRRARPDLLVRDNCLIVSFSFVRAVIQHNKVTIFHCDRENVKNFVNSLQAHVASFKQTVSRPYDYLKHEENDFELVVLEGILSTVCESYRKKAAILAPLVDGVIAHLSDEKSTFTDALHQLLPMKDNLSNFEIETSLSRDTLGALLRNDEDMLGMLLSEKNRRDGRAPPPEAHRSVELMLENYCSILVNVAQEVYFLRKRVESVQSIIELKLDSHRNRLLSLSIQLAIGTVALSWSTAVAGVFGMNLPSGLENEPRAFWAVVGSSTLGAGMLFAWLNGWFATLSPQQFHREADFDAVFFHLDEIQAVFEHGKTGPGGNEMLFSREEFLIAMRALKIDKNVADLVWASFVRAENDNGETWLNESPNTPELKKVFDMNLLKERKIRAASSSSSSSSASSFPNNK